MKTFLLILILLSSCQLFAQAEFLDTQTTASTSFQLPLRTNTSGQLAFIQTPDDIMIGPAIGAAYSKSTVQFINPVKISKEMSLISPIAQERGWMEIRKRRYDGGLGLAVIIGNNLNAGLIPFKGAMQTTIRMKERKDEEVRQDFRMPLELKEVESWRVGDQGTYQTYGGVEAMLALGVSIVNIARTSVAFQNQFIIEIRKVSAKHVVFSIAEEKLQRSESSVGPLVSKVALKLFRGMRFSSEFVLDLTNPSHHELFQNGLQGKINKLQGLLDHKLQRLKWLGSATSFYLGIPFLIGVEKSDGKYSINLDGNEADMSIKTRFSKGMFATQGEHNRLVYRTDDVVLLLWNSQMKKAKDNVMEKYFFKFGRSIGLKGFGDNMPRGKYGSVLTQIGITLQREEIMSIKNLNRSQLNDELRVKCESLNLKCRHEGKRAKMLKELAEVMEKPWDKMSFELGKLLMKNPALIHSILRTSRMSKEVYVKFLNDNYQSVEGMLAVDL